MAYELKVVTHFAAAHQLKMVSKKCENLHGHNWKVEACLTGDRLNKAGVLIDFGEIKGYLSPIISMLDHTHLNELDAFNDGNPPSSENIARYIAEALRAAMDDTGVTVSKVKVWESVDACATYIL